MAHNLSDVDTFTSAVTVPDDGDDRSAASVELPFQALANRTFYNKTQFENLGVTDGLYIEHLSGIRAATGPIVAILHDVLSASGFLYCNATGAPAFKSRTVLAYVGLGIRSGWDNSGTSDALSCTVTGSGPIIPLPFLTSGSRVTMVRVAYDNTGTTNTPSFSLVRQVPVKSGTPSSGALNVERSDTDGTAGTTSATAQIMSTGTFTSSTVNRATDLWFVRLGTAIAVDRIIWVEVTYDDPGPRNY
jgi:hypothetical protein